MKNMSRLIGRIIIAAIPILAITTYTMIKITEKPEFCSTCHNMKPYYRAWKTSTHSEVLCIECHYPPSIAGTIEGKFKALSQIAKYVTRTEGTRPWAEIDDASCLRSECHERRLLEGKIDFKGIHFDHAPHLNQLRRGKQLRCTSCHSQMVMGDHIAVTASTCFTCHFKDMPPGEALGGCTACHSVPEGIIKVKGMDFNHKAYIQRGVTCNKCHVRVTEGDGRVPFERCISCHGEPERLQKFDDHEFIHKNHVTDHKVECYECHLEIKHGSYEVLESIMPPCENCHKDTHSAQRDMYMGVGGRGIPNKPSAMQIGSVDCRSCHILNEQAGKTELSGRIMKAAPMACMHCHGVQFGGMLDDWQGHLDENLKRLELDMNAAEKTLKSWNTNAETKNKAVDIFKNAQRNYELVSMGKGAHNIPYAVELLKYSSEGFTAIKSMNTTAIEAITTQSVEPVADTKTCTSACHLVPPTKTLTPFPGKSFPHERHNNVKGVYCTTCHNNTEDKHGLLYINKQDCASCHHGRQLATECIDCHTSLLNATIKYQDKTFRHAAHVGNAKIQCLSCHSFNSTTATYSFSRDCNSCHHTSDVKCQKCHTAENKEIINSSMDFECEMCHEKGSAAFTSPNNCAGCHDDKSSSLFTHTDKKCADCHRRHSWKIKTPDTCMRCHKKLTDDHIENGFTECADCHKPHD